LSSFEGAKPSGDLETVHVREIHVHEDKRETAVPKPLRRLLAAGCEHDAEAHPAEISAEHEPMHAVVFDDQQLRRRLFGDVPHGLDATTISTPELPPTQVNDPIRLAVRASTEALFLWRRDEPLVWNERLEGVFGARPEEVSTLDELLGRVHHADRGRTRGEIHALLDSTTQSELETEFRFKRPEEGYAVALLRAVVERADDGTVASLAGALRDVTAIRAAVNALGDAHELLERIQVLESAARERNELLSGVLASLGSGVIACDAAGRPLLCNDAATEITGATEPATHTVVSFIDHFGFVSAVGARLTDSEFPLSRALAGQESDDVELVVRRPDGGMRFLDASGRALRDESGRIAGAVLTFQDVTARRRAEQAAAAAMRTRSAFLAAMSHEIRTPLGAIVGITSLLPELIGDEHELVATLKTSSEHLVSVVNDVLDFTKLESGRLELSHEPFDLAVCVESALDLVAIAAAEKGLELVYDFDDDVPETMTGDPGRLRQVLVNLLGNAVKFTQRGEVVLVARRASQDGALLIEVRDTGPGILPEAMERLFVPFSQGDASTTRAFGGTGLGLVISRRLIEAMGGWVDVASTPGVGSTFIVSIPCESPPRSSPRVVLGGRSALVVDDHDTSRRALGKLLRRWGFDVVEVSTPYDAEARLFERRFDAIIVDTQVADEDGAALLDRMGASDPTIQTVALTPPGVSRVVPAGTTVLTKPVKPRELGRAVLGRRDPRRRTPSDPSSRAVQRLRVLVAEDQPVNRRVVATMLERLGHDVVLAANGVEAVAAVGTDSFDAILMDMHMPRMDGLEATRRIRAALGGDDVLVLGVTANAAEDDRQACLVAGMNEVLTKPFTLQQLAAQLKRVTVTASSSSPPPVRRDALARLRSEIGDAIFDEVLAVYLQETPGKVARIVESAAAGELAQVASVAHGLKSTSGTLGADALVEVADRIESHARANRLDETRAHVASLPLVYSEVDRALRLDLRSGAEVARP
jgi:signal transduction histidine kinase/CheY-like chemotaxis protein/HPt (histidine-containing phosphotransfer) domain-containing protein